MAFVSTIGKRQPILGYAREPRNGAEIETTGGEGRRGEVITQAWG